MAGQSTIRIEVAVGALLAAVALLIVSLMGGHDAGSARSGSSKGSAAAAAAATADASAKAVASRHSALDAGPLLEGAPLAMHVYLMSRCPFGARLLRALDAANDWLDGRISLRVDFIVGQHADKPLAVGGPDELATDAVLLCAIEQTSQRAWLPFAACIGTPPGDWKACAQRAKLDAARIARCIATRGPSMLAQSALRARAADATRSPTLFIAGRRHDGPRATFDLVREACARLEPPLPVVCWAELEGRAPPHR
ncbi:MAG: hypothetical protein KC503_05125 [Myxococcales bacterium]|nr:hypothetical protein [Myxococcales bacterium]